MTKADKRSVVTDALETLGTIIDENAGRDAIHVAVEPVQAGEKLYPGQDVGILGGYAHGKGVVHLGIVDPFLKGPVQLDEWFWMLLYPRTITSLRHAWSHPAFEDVADPQSVASDKAASEAWLREFCAHADCPMYETVIAAVAEENFAEWDQNYLHFEGRDAHGAIPNEFWDHCEVVLGRKFEHRATYFSCSC